MSAEVRTIRYNTLDAYQEAVIVKMTLTDKDNIVVEMWSEKTSDKFVFTNRLKSVKTTLYGLIICRADFKNANTFSFQSLVRTKLWIKQVSTAKRSKNA